MRGTSISSRHGWRLLAWLRLLPGAWLHLYLLFMRLESTFKDNETLKKCLTTVGSFVSKASIHHCCLEHREARTYGTNTPTESLPYKATAQAALHHGSPKNCPIPGQTAREEASAHFPFCLLCVADGNGCRLNAGLPARSLYGEMMSSWLLMITEHRRHSPCCQGDKANKHTGLPLSADGLLSVVLAKGAADQQITQICDEKSCKNKGFVEGDDGRDAGIASSKNGCTYF